MSYTFARSEVCNMCGASTLDAATLGRRLNAHQGLRPTRKQGVTVSVQRCSVCGLVFPNPMPVPGTLAQHYEIPPEAYWTREHLEQSTSAAESQAREFLNRWTGERGRPTVLDVGAGTGRMMLAFQDSGFDTWGIEPSEHFRRRALEQRIPPERLLLAPIESAELPTDGFDFISMSAVLEHLPDPAGALARALRWLAPRGLIRVEVPSSDWLIGRLLNLAYRLQGLDFVTNTSPMHSPFHLYEFTRHCFVAHGERAGYRVADSRMFTGDTFVPRAFQRAARQLMAASDSGMVLEVWLSAAGRRNIDSRACPE
jgi:SAM-dependent methyltransferase